MQDQRVISMVPSWTETLIECGVPVVGRTRFCIHPERAKSIPAVGGTKDIDWKKVKALSPTLIILDKEENPKAMADECEYPYIATHIRTLSDVSRDLQRIGEELQNQSVLALSERWKVMTSMKVLGALPTEIPGILEWIKKPQPKNIKKIIYLIWTKPWMAVSKNTFIGSVLCKLGLGEFMIDFEEPYPQVDLGSFDPASTLLLFSTEPFPFHKKPKIMEGCPHFSATVNGEAFSWFGVRTLKFLEENVR